ncbi:MAG: hypothetical protein LBT27_09605 [Prevotellaceae bacterium]|jgi:hypothetical protein|nr:hypothetical protein [Prevotellaceae bacterium]
MNKIIILAIATFGMLEINAQVGINEENPQPFSILEMNGKGTMGLGLPQMSGSQIAALSLSGNLLAEGLVVFNADTRCVNTWNGTEWITTCADIATTLPSATPDINTTGGSVGIGTEMLQSFSALELFGSNTQGMRLPQMTTAQREMLTSTSDFISVKTNYAAGLSVFNTTTKCWEIWNGEVWISACGM